MVGCLAVGNLHANVMLTDDAVGTLRNNKILGGKTGHVRVAFVLQHGGNLSVRLVGREFW